MDNHKKLSNSFWVGIIVLTIGSFLLLDRLEMMEFPGWLFSWKTMLIAIGLVVGLNKRFKGVGWLVLILIGSFFLLEDIPGITWELHDYAFPIGVIIVGLFILSRAVLGGGPSKEKREFWKNQNDGLVASDEGGEDYFDIVAVFGGSKRKVFSKTLKVVRQPASSVVWMLIFHKPILMAPL